MDLFRDETGAFNFKARAAYATAVASDAVFRNHVETWEAWHDYFESKTEAELVDMLETKPTDLPNHYGEYTEALKIWAAWSELRAIHMTHALNWMAINDFESLRAILGYEGAAEIRAAYENDQ